NIVVFGESGVGKSSVINMMLKSTDTPAKISSDAAGCTFQSTPYPVEISGSHYTVWDTAGLNEATTVPAKDAVTNAFKLIQKLQGGICLLLYVIRGPRVKEFTIKNYQMFYEGFCQKNVPIILVVTGLEEEDDMDDWWTRNKWVFDRKGMTFSGQACITASKGKWKASRQVFAYEEEYQESMGKVTRLIKQHALKQPWRMDLAKWY
ncbi:hypothetical protein SISNIDRAFT_393112, partial [Sistotremastrum niveocremeum HHB9708]